MKRHATDRPSRDGLLHAGGIRKLFFLIVCIVGVLVGTLIQSARGGELLQNGSFDDVMFCWSIPDELDPWNPYRHPDGNATIHPLVSGHVGPVFRQNVNVAPVGGETVTLSVDVDAQHSPGDGNTLSVHVVYVDSGGALVRAQVMNPDNSVVTPGTPVTVTETHEFPPDAVRLVAVEVAKESWGTIWVDNISVTHPTLAPGPVPVLGRVTPGVVTYGQAVTVQGTGFGSAEGSVTIGDSSAGLTINSWSDTAISVTVNDPAPAGFLHVTTAERVTANEKRSLQIATPYFTAREFRPADQFDDPQTGARVAVAGQTVEVVVDVDCHNDYDPVGGISFSVPEQPGATAWPANLAGDGGTAVEISTVGLAKGTHTFTVQATGAGLLPRSFTVDIDVRIPGDFELRYDTDGMGTMMPAPDPFVVSAQGPVQMQGVLKDDDGNDISGFVDLGWSTGNPAVFGLYQSPEPWYPGPSLLVHDNGTAQLSAHGPGGLRWDHDVQVAVPGSPKITDLAMVPATLSNSGVDTATVTFTADAPMTGFSWNISNWNITVENSGFGPDNTTFFMELRSSVGMTPGSHLVTGTATTAAGSVTRTHLLHVVSPLTHGSVRGHVALFADPFNSHGANGRLYFHDAATGDELFSRDIWEWTWDYTVGFIPPGDYKLRWWSGDGMEFPPDQWYPNAYDIADAGVVTVTAGGFVTGISFFMDVIPGEVVVPGFAGPPVRDSAAGTFRVEMPMTPGYTHVLQKSTSGRDGTWIDVMQLSGDGVGAFEDASADDPTAIYRVQLR